MTNTEKIVENAMRKVMAEFFPQLGEYLTTKEVMMYLDISRQSVTNWTKKGILKPVGKEKNKNLFLRDDVESLKNRDYE